MHKYTFIKLTVPEQMLSESTMLSFQLQRNQSMDLVHEVHWCDYYNSAKGQRA